MANNVDLSGAGLRRREAQGQPTKRAVKGLPLDGSLRLPPKWKDEEQRRSGWRRGPRHALQGELFLSLLSKLVRLIGLAASTPRARTHKSPYVSPPPRICRQTAHERRPSARRNPPQRVRCRRRSRPTPCAQPSTAAQARSAAFAPRRGGRRFCPPRQNRGGPPAPPALANARSASRLQAEWGHGVGRHARQMRGEIVSTCKELRVRSKSAGYKRICTVDVPRSQRLSFFQREHTRVRII